MKKEHYLNIFQYLLEFAKIRAKSVRDIIIQKNYYPEVLWINDIPDANIFSHILKEDHKNTNVWVSIGKPTGDEPKPPQIPAPPSFVNAFNRSALLNEDETAYIKDQYYNEDEELIELDDHPKIRQEINLFLAEEWPELEPQYRKLHEKYLEDLTAYRAEMDLYKLFFSIFNRIQQFGEEYELVMGCGLIQLKASENNNSIRRHLFTTKVDIDFVHKGETSKIIIRPIDDALVTIETDAIVDLEQAFEIQGVIDAERNAKDLIDNAETDYGLFSQGIHELIELFKSRIHPEGKSSNNLEPLVQFPEKPVITYAPALLFRKRNTKGLTSVYEHIIEDITESENVDISILDDMIGFDKEPNCTENEEYLFNTTVDNTLFFPKVYNDEQVQIVQHATYNNKTLVQGPPGTGKSHTISNLISHLLANGNKVLVSAHTKRALEVLKEKLPDQVKPLCVELLGSDSVSIQGLKESVNGINDELSSYSYQKYRDEIIRLTSDLRSNRENQARLKDKLLQLKEKNLKLEVNPLYIGSPTQLTERVYEEIPEFEWYQDSFSNFKDENTISVPVSYLQWKREFDELGVDPATVILPDLNNLLSVEEYEDYWECCNVLFGEYTKRRTHEVIESENLEEVEELLIGYLKLRKFIDESKLSIKDNILNTNVVDDWSKMVADSIELISGLKLEIFQKLDSEIEIEIFVDHSLKRLIGDLKILQKYVLKGNALDGLAFKIKKVFLPTDIKEKLYVINQIKVNGSPTDTIEKIEIVLNYLTSRQVFEELEDIWGLVPQKKKFSQFYEFYESLTKDTDSIIESLINSREIENKLRGISSLDLEFSETEIDEIGAIIEDIDYNRSLRKVKAFDDKRESAKEEFEAKDVFLEIEELFTSANKNYSIGDYQDMLNKINYWSNIKSKYLSYIEIKSKCTEIFPKLSKSIEEGKVNDKEIKDLFNAVCHYHAYGRMHKFNKENQEEELLNSLDDLENSELKILENLAAKKSWFSILGKLQEDKELKRNMLAWVNAVAKSPKTGSRAIKKKRIAQGYMEKCKEAIPCWIMPVFKVADTIVPKQGMFDYVIIDEASQLGPDAIFLSYIAKKIIIVGDDKQTSPEYVGISSETMTPHIARHLSDIPFNDHYGTDYSFFDHAKLFCDGMIVLREHFRCMPEIIEFSNKHFYEPERKALYPLKQYSSNRLEPLKHIFIQEGFVQGKGGNITNEPEADKIVTLIKELANDSNYKGKTFGVICLQGTKQAELIENKLIQAIGDVEYEKRKIVCGNSSSFQGDERDVIFLSLVTASNHDRRALSKAQDERRYNVAMSRALEQVWLFTSVKLTELNSNDLRHKLLDHFLNYRPESKIISKPITRTKGSQPEPFDSWFEVDVYNDIVNKGYNIIPQYEVAKGKYRIDLALVLSNGIKIAIECDGDQYHGAEQYADDMARQKVLERVGWQFFRVRGIAYYINAEKSLEHLWQIIELNELSSEVYDDENINTTNENLFEATDSNYEEEQEVEIEIKEDEPDVFDSIQESTNKVLDGKQTSIFPNEGKDTNIDIGLFQSINHRKVAVGDIVTLINLTNQTKLKIRITSDKTSTQLDKNAEIKIIHDKTPLALGSINKSIGERVKINNINVQYEIENIEDNVCI